jgi:hypothetical protein
MIIVTPTLPGLQPEFKEKAFSLAVPQHPPFTCLASETDCHFFTNKNCDNSVFSMEL